MSDPVETAYNKLMAPYERGQGDLEDAGYAAVRTMEMWIELKRQIMEMIEDRAYSRIRTECIEEQAARSREKLVLLSLLQAIKIAESKLPPDGQEAP